MRLEEFEFFRLQAAAKYLHASIRTAKVVIAKSYN
jgi:hypothetical protein